MTSTRDSGSLIGQGIPQLNARDKVTGRALYGGDLKMPGMWHIKVLRSPFPHARIVAIDTSKALTTPGVKAVFTGEDTPTRLSGIHHKEHRVLATGKVRFIGEEVVAVVATDEEIARDALDLITVKYEELPRLASPEEAGSPDAVEVHAGTHNLAQEYQIVRGDVDSAFGRCAEIHESIYDVHSQYPGYLEPMATVAWRASNDRLHVWTPTQNAFLLRGRLAEALETPVSSIRVIQATTGGGFGGKTLEECNSLICAWIATKLRNPVRFINSRLDDFQGARSSVPERIWLKMGVDTNGLILAKDVRIVADCGAYAGLAPHVLQVSAIRSDNMHRHLKDVRSHATLYYTNNPPHGAFRGFGGQQMTFAVNTHVDVLAQRLGIDTIEMHKRNAVQAGDVSVHGFQIGSSGLSDCLDQVSREIDWTRKRRLPKGDGPKRRGIGVGAAIHVSGNREMGNWDGSTIILRMGADGRVSLLTGEADMGQGSFTVLAQICAQELSIPMSHVTVLPLDTDASPFGLGAICSRVTTIGGRAAIQASRQMRETLLALATEKLDAKEEDLIVENGEIFVASARPNRRVSYGELASLHLFRKGGEGLQVTASYDAPTVMANKQQFGNVAPAYSFAAQAVEVEVDIETGQVSVIDACIADDCGKALNPLAVHGQSCGAAVQAIGWTLFEQLQYERCELQNGNFADYTMPTADSVPTIRSGIVESIDPNGPYGAKGASETAIVPGAGAIANAVHDAIGIRIRSLPITPEKVLAELRSSAAAAIPTAAKHA